MGELGDKRPGSDRPEPTEQAFRLQRLRSRVDELEEQLRRLHEQTAAEWSRFDGTQQTVPQEARLTYTSWYASLWGPKISIVRTELDSALTAWKLIEAQTLQQD